MFDSSFAPVDVILQHAMKLDSESPFHHTCPPHKHDTKVIAHNDSPFIIAKDNHYMIDMLNIDKEALNEGKHGLTSPIERKSAKVTSPPKKYLNFEDSFNRNKTDDESREVQYSTPSGFEMVVKEDFYTDKIITKIELPEMKVCIEEDPCHIVKDIAIDKGVQSSDRGLVENDVGLIELYVSNQTLDNGHNDSSSEMASPAGSDDLKYTVCNSPLIIVDKDQADLASILHNGFDGRGSSVCNSPLIIVDKDQADLASILHNGFDGRGSSVGSFDSGVKLHTTASVVSNISTKITEIPADQASVFYNDSDGKGSFVSSFNSDGNLDATESVVSNISSKVLESPAVPALDVHNEREGKNSSVSSIYWECKLDTSEDTETPAVPASDVHNECDGMVSSGSSIYCWGKLDTSESVASNTSAEVTETSAIPTSGVHNECVEKGYVSSIDSGVKLDTYESIASNISAESTQSQLPSSQEITTDSLHGGSSHLVFCNDEKQSVDGQKYKDVSVEGNSASTALPFPSEVVVSALGNGSKEIPADYKVPSGVITFSFETDAASTSGRDENKETTNNEQSEVANNGPGAEEGMIDGPAVSRCSFLHLMEGESNLSGPDFLSGPIANSGHIPYSGSISLRSDSSTTSARSFAFPTLQSEWNSSPVKMAKADRRHLRKHRGWRMGLLCCRF